MNRKIQAVAAELKRRYRRNIKFWSLRFSARPPHDQRKGSDIDIFVLLPHVERRIEEDLFNIAYDIELKYDCLIDLIVFGKDGLDEVLSQTPLYRQVVEEGIAV